MYIHACMHAMMTIFGDGGGGVSGLMKKKKDFFEKHGIYKDYVAKYQCIVYAIPLECI